jgi:hypothetical protein
MSKKSGAVKIRLLTGKSVYVQHPGPLPEILILETSSDEGPGARVPCRRVDVQLYRQMTVEQMIEAGLIKPVVKDTDAEAEAGGQPTDEQPVETGG